MNLVSASTIPITLLVWDAPNIDMSLGSILGGRPSSASRPRFDALGRWLINRAGTDTEPEATVFTNVAPGSTDFVRPWVEALRNTGFAVFAKPKIDESDIDEDMLTHIRSRHRQGVLRQLMVASGSVSDPARAISQRPRASNRGRDAELGRPPRIEPRLMSMLGASQTSSVIGMADAGAGFMVTILPHGRAPTADTLNTRLDTPSRGVTSG